VERQQVSRRATFIYGKGSVVTGQQRASELVLAGLEARGWQTRAITTPLLDRSRDTRIRQLLGLGPRLVSAWVKGLAALRSSDIMHVGLGQTPFALLRDGVPLVTGDLSRFDAQAVVSLNGSLFMCWSYGSIQAQILRRLVRAARYVTVVGPGQRDQMIRLGIPPEKVIWMDNACELAPIAEGECVAKHADTETQPLRVLYLSNLLETKGYTEFVRAIGCLADGADVPVEATLCGPIVRMDGDVLFSSTEEARSWLQSQVVRISALPRVRLRWIEGAYGADK
jgi:hypothetical protein